MNVRRMIRFSLALAMTVLLATCAAGEGVSRALLIGCDRFVSMPDTTPAAENNLSLMETLVRQALPGLDRVKVRLDGPRTAAEFTALAAEAFAGADETDVSLVYLTTHGVAWTGGDTLRTALLLSDGTIEEGLEPETLRRILDTVPGRKALIVDACYSGALIAKGMAGGVNAFAGGDYRVLVSCGGEEESFLWSAGEARQTGAGFFTAALATCLQAANWDRLDADRDGAVSLAELRDILGELYGPATAYAYPEQSGEPLFALTETEEDAAPLLSGLWMEARDEAGEPAVGITFQVNRPLRLWYQMISWEADGWDFEGAVRLPDRERTGGVRGAMKPGEKQRTVRLGSDSARAGYALLQLISTEEGAPMLEASRVVCVPAEKAAIQAVTAADGFRPAAGEEASGCVVCTGACALDVFVLDQTGQTVRTLARGAATRPGPEGSRLYVYWDGRSESGDPALPGSYRFAALCAGATTGTEALSAPFQLMEEMPKPAEIEIPPEKQENALPGANGNR